MGVLITHDLKKKFIYCNLRPGTFGKSSTWDETITVVTGVRSNLIPYCFSKKKNLSNIAL
jgi:hypothetical protein